jgi:phosphoenolpyruvate-protein phosphotransferase (PTS system enzyme I)
MSAVGPRCLSGQPAAPGVVHGRIVEIVNGAPTHALSGAARMSLAAAMSEAAAQLENLAASTSDANARKILEFQIEFLRDPELLEPVQDQLAADADPGHTWITAIDAQIDDFESSDDEYFRHRAADVRDLRARVLAVLAGHELGPLTLPDDAILLADDLAPSRFLATQWRPQQAIALRGGSPTAHVALLARASRVPMVVGVGPVSVPSGCTAILDGAAGTLQLAPDSTHVQEYARRKTRLDEEGRLDAGAAARPAITANGERVQVLLNISTVAELDAIDPAICDGIGLVRTELLFAHGPPDEAAQFDAYWRIVRWAGGRPVVIRTLDAGGDKPIADVTIDGETNPFLGVRGVRLSLAAPDVFKVQLRALLRAAVGGALKLMIPMVTTPDEVAQVRRMLLEARLELLSRSVPFAVPQVGIMVEVPATALALDVFDIDFASIGSNDLLQYTMAAARDNQAVSALADPTHPGFVRLLQQIVDRAAARGISLSLCGDLAAQAQHVPLLLSAGLRSLSMPPASVGAIKRAIATWPSAE